MPKSVLIIEDDVDSRAMYGLVLERAGFTVYYAEDGPAGIVKAAEHVPTMVLLDIGLPSMDGWDVCRALNRDPATAGIKVVVLTAHAFLSDGARAAGCITVGFITKPASPLRVLEEIERLIGKAVEN
jgi:two-component system, cell cycle response regulator DivK